MVTCYSGAGCQHREKIFYRLSSVLCESVSPKIGMNCPFLTAISLRMMRNSVTMLWRYIATLFWLASTRQLGHGDNNIDLQRNIFLFIADEKLWRDLWVYFVLFSLSLSWSPFVWQNGYKNWLSVFRLNTQLWSCWSKIKYKWHVDIFAPLTVRTLPEDNIYHLSLL